MNPEIPPQYEAKNYEANIYKKWEESKAFSPKIDKSKEPFTIALPPPNATGTLHLGHAVMLSVQDILIRHQRMLGRSSLWIPGTDHAAIATQNVVEKKLQKEGITNPRKELGREKLISEIKSFVAESKDVIRNQMRKMGSSCDWEREKYTLDEEMNQAVNTLFQYMFEDELIYQGGRIVNWDPNMQTTVADDEVEHKEEKTKFYYFQFGPVVIGTARPETKFLDKVIIVHPDDERYKDLIGKEFEFEWIDGPITAKVIADECADMEMGTGAMSITPAHSHLDFELAEKYELEVTQIIDFEGNIKPEISEEFGGMPIKEARQKIVEKLKKKGLAVKIDEEYVHNIALNYRGKGVIEPQVMKQWFIDVNKKVIDWKGEKLSIKEVLQDVVRSEMIEIIPGKFEKIYFHWINNLKDWCISRQIWWGHRIPVWHKVTQEQYDAFNAQPGSSSLLLTILGVDGEKRVGTKKPDDGLWIQDPDTLDTWFSSALWTFSTLGWPNKTDELEYFHPTSVLETGYDILFFWVARMILASTYALRKDGLPEEKTIPFKKIYLHGLIRDINGKKMSKSNPETCIDPLDMIEKYGADALRLSLVIGSTPGNDMRLHEEKIAGYRNFVNKIWNAARFGIINLEEQDTNAELTAGDIKSTADKWILTKLDQLIAEVDQDLKNFRLSDAGTKIYEFLWGQFCDWYLEASKGRDKNPAVLLHVLKSTLKLLHPFVPYVTEVLWEKLNQESLLINEKWPTSNDEFIFPKEAADFEQVKKIIGEIRSIRAEAAVEPAKKVNAIIVTQNHVNTVEKNAHIIQSLARIESLTVQTKREEMPKSKSAVVDGIEIFLPLKNLIDPAKEKARLEKEIKKKQDFVTSLEKKLNNKGFTENAPQEVVEQQKARLDQERTNIEKLLRQMEDIVV